MPCESIEPRYERTSLRVGELLAKRRKCSSRKVVISHNGKCGSCVLQAAVRHGGVCARRRTRELFAPLAGAEIVHIKIGFFFVCTVLDSFRDRALQSARMSTELSHNPKMRFHRS